MYRFFVFLLTAAALSGSLLVCFYASGRDYYSLREIVLPSRTGPSSKHDDTTTANGKGTQDVLLGPPLAAVRPDMPRKLDAPPFHPPDTTTRLLGLPFHVSQPTISPSPFPPSSSSSSMGVNEPQVAPKAVLVISTTKENDMNWLHDELGDLLEPTTEAHGYFSTEIYVTDNVSAPLHTPANKGHEAMAYLTYIIDQYHTLPPISIFIHGHLLAWHNNIMLNSNTSSMLRHLRLDKIHQDGYFNLRCHFNPGCPEHLFPFSTVPHTEKSEEPFVKEAWKQVFEIVANDAEAEALYVPRVLAQPCCSQFAVTATRIRAVPREKYVHFRNWILETALTDYMSGRIFEYFWQWIFNGTAVFCPDPRVCYCEGYGICFEGPEEYDAWMKLKKVWEGYEKELREWREWKEEREKNEKEKEQNQNQNQDQNQGGGEGDYDGDDHTMEQENPSLSPPPPLLPPPSQTSNPSSLYPEEEEEANPFLPPLGPPPSKSKKSNQPPLELGLWLISQMDSIQAELDRRIADAMVIGADPQRRLAAIRASDELPASEKGESWS